MGLYKTQNRLEQSETLTLFFSKNNFKVHFIEKKIVFHFAPFSPIYSKDKLESTIDKIKNGIDSFKKATRKFYDSLIIRVEDSLEFQWPGYYSKHCGPNRQNLKYF
jgi:hypothetical protein